MAARIAEYYRSRTIGCCVFSVDERLTGAAGFQRRSGAFASENSDIVMAFASVDPCVRRCGEGSAPFDRKGGIVI